MATTVATTATSATMVSRKRKAPVNVSSGDSFDAQRPAEKKQKATVGIATDRGGKMNQEVRHVYLSSSRVKSTSVLWETTMCICNGS